ncbi:MAG: hypothetical protein QXE80_03470 [Pyrobaculum sp.]
MDNFQELLVELLKSGNYAALLILFLLATIWYLSKALKQKDEFILKQYENLQEGMNKLGQQLEDDYENILQSVAELKTKVSELERIILETKFVVSNVGRDKGGK